jgi:uncharacterized protein YndB with AHSA1/START domain
LNLKTNKYKKEKTMPNSTKIEKINWPAKFKPSYYPIYIHNQIDINASPDKVWFWLTNATTWHEWYFNAADVKIFNQPQSNFLLAGTKFNWKTCNVYLDTQVKEFVPNERLSWLAKGKGVSAYHAWLIIPTKNGCKVITDESQRGWICRFGARHQPNNIYENHQIWLEGLKEKSEQE